MLITNLSTALVSDYHRSLFFFFFFFFWGGGGGKPTTFTLFAFRLIILREISNR